MLRYLFAMFPLGIGTYDPKNQNPDPMDTGQGLTSPFQKPTDGFEKSDQLGLAVTDLKTLGIWSIRILKRGEKEEKSAPDSNPLPYRTPLGK